MDKIKPKTTEQDVEAFKRFAKLFKPVDIEKRTKAMKAEEAFIKCTKVLDYEPMTNILESIYDLALAGVSAEDIVRRYIRI